MKITFICASVVVVWMCCLIDNSTSETELQPGRHLLQLNAERQDKMKRHLIVTTILNRPFMTQKEQTNRSPENERYEGFLVDMLELLSKRLNFTYTIRPVKDGKYGAQSPDGTWSGMIGEIISGEADIAIADLTTTSARKYVVDFTIPFMTSGIGILMKKPETPSMHMLFLMPFDTNVWISGIVAFSSISVLLFIMARVSRNEWISSQSSTSGSYQRHNNLNFCNSLWFSFASLTQQASRVAPRAIATRVLSATWWIFTFFFIAFYIANLAAILVHQMEVSAHGAAIQSVEDLARQTSVKYGTLKGGSTMAFFKNSQVDMYVRMYAFMESTTPPPYTKSYSEGLERVKAGGYALFMESASIEYTTERSCDVMQVGGLLDYRGYGIAMTKDSPMRRDFSVAILELQDKGILLALKTKWWGLKEGSCKNQPKKESTRGALTLESIGGIFVILILGSIVALVIGVVELFVKASRTSKEEGGSLCDEVMRELKFGLCGGNKNPSSPEGIILQRQDHM